MYLSGTFMLRFLNNVKLKQNNIYKQIFRRTPCLYKSSLAKMNQRLLEMQRTRQKVNQIKNMTNPSHVSLQIVGSGAPGASKSLYVSTTASSYLFNCGEGMQRLAFEHHHKLTRLSQVFITTPIWSNLGGLPGLALTIEKIGVPQLVLHGPDGTTDMMEVIKKFVILKDMAVVKPTLNDSLTYEDQAIIVQYVPLQGKPNDDDNILNTPELEVIIDNTDYYSYEFKNNGKRTLQRKKDNECKKINKVEIDINSGRICCSMAYICKLHPKAGTLSLEKCVEKGISPGPILGKLKSGENVTLSDGTLVRSKDVCSPPQPGPLFIVVDCQNEDFLDSLISNIAFEKHFAVKAEKNDDIPYCIVHFTPEDILNNSRYKEWMQKFGSNTQHLILNESNTCFSSEGVHKMQHQLHLIHPTVFPFLNEETLINEMNNAKETPENIGDNKLLIHRAKNQQVMHLRPLKGLDTSMEVELHPTDYVDEIFKIEGFLDSLAELQTNINEKTKSLGTLEEYPKLIMLGTGSSIPSKTRNTSGILLQISENESMVFDCGEGTLGQMYRFFGKPEAERILATIKVVYISHLHADHHIGLIGLLKARERVNSEPIYLLAPEQIGSWLRLYHSRFEAVLKTLILISNKTLFMGHHTLPKEIENKLYTLLNISDISTVYVRHCPYAFGVSITLKDGKKIVYSGDTMPCDFLVALGLNCHLVIHEATHEDDMLTEAREKKHSTISQAIEVGKKMKAKYILLTHFSQRYAKIPQLPEREFDLSNVGFAYDNMQIRISELPLLSLFDPTLRVMFSEFCEELVKKANKRQMRHQMKEVNNQELEVIV